MGGVCHKLQMAHPPHLRTEQTSLVFPTFLQENNGMEIRGDLFPLRFTALPSQEQYGSNKI